MRTSDIRSLLRARGWLGLLAVCTIHVVVVCAQRASRSHLVNDGERAVVIDAVLSKLAVLYVDPEVARNMGVAIRAHQEARRYDGVTNGEEFARVLTGDLQSVSGDKHLVVEFAATRSGETEGEVPPEPPAVSRPRDSRGCSVVNVATLDGNVGYAKLNEFRSPSVCAEPAAAVLRLVADCDALIFDLQDNLGGDPTMVAFMLSYLFSKPTHLTDIYERRTNVTYESWTKPFVPGPRFLDRPVFVLISRRTFSAAEEFAYDLQMLGRAAVVGEASGGGAHPAESFPVNGRFSVVVPVGRYINPVSRTNWEGRGVIPDIRVPERVAVQAAYREALRQLVRTNLSAAMRSAMQRQIEALTRIVDAQRSR